MSSGRLSGKHGAAAQPHLDEDARSVEDCRGGIRHTPCRTRTIHNQSPAVPRWYDSAGAVIPPRQAQAVEIQAYPRFVEMNDREGRGNQKKHLIALQVLFLYGGRD
ncbi:hypothetical protein [Paenibacillus popilliae]|uniref:hypothetical protein n=1 Tax=Paenibacillus popilliae TaxID=78057 RepID=UPI0002E64586|nr:hypothetical protein [Paenibacillus popilliae]